MSSNIRVPVMPEPYRSIDRHISAPITRNVLFAPGSYFTEEQLAALNAEWLEKVGPVVEALEENHAYIFNHAQSDDFKRYDEALYAVTQYLEQK